MDMAGPVAAPAHSPTLDAAPDPARATTATPEPTASVPQGSLQHPLVRAARQQIGVTRYYDPAYVRLDYPGGDVPQDRGVCTDVVIRALRSEGLDLQQVVHEDMRNHFADYPALWGLRGPDRNIDHRRVPNLRRWFERQGWSLPASEHATDYLPGDLVTWRLDSGVPHIGIVSERRSTDGTPRIIHNIGQGTREDDILFDHAITGHYRRAN
jgi:uncharacterized protein YijF (DUF1287 family)